MPSPPDALIPICTGWPPVAHAVRVRAEDGTWVPVIDPTAAAALLRAFNLTHGICPTCERAIRDDLDLAMGAPPPPTDYALALHARPTDPPATKPTPDDDTV